MWTWLIAKPWRILPVCFFVAILGWLTAVTVSTAVKDHELLQILAQDYLNRAQAARAAGPAK